MKNNLEDLTIADLKALIDDAKERMDKHDSYREYYSRVYVKSTQELVKRVKLIFGKQ